MVVIGITGKVGSGKGAVSKYLESKYGFAHYSARNYLTLELLKRGLPVTRQTLIDTANEIRTTKGAGFIIQELYKMAKALGKNSIIESFRTPGEINVLKSTGKFYLLAVDVNQKTRFERIVKRNSETDHISFEQFVKDDNTEDNSADPNKINIAACIKMADFILDNNGTLEELYRQIDLIMKKINISI